MYVSKNIRILSRTILLATGVHILGILVRALIRMMMREQTGLPDMASSRIWDMQMMVEGVQFILTALIFLLEIKRMRSYINVVDADDRRMMGRLQEDTLGDKLSTLSAETVYHLLEIWAVIFIGVRLVQSIISFIYRQFAMELFSLYTDGLMQKKGRLTAIYNTTHGFKYVAMMCAILMGVMVTAIILKDRALKVATLIVSAVFILSFSFVNMTQIRLLGQVIGIVWTSIIFHIIETVGLVAFAVYLRHRYQGV